MATDIRLPSINGEWMDGWTMPMLMLVLLKSVNAVPSVCSFISFTR